MWWRSFFIGFSVVAFLAAALKPPMAYAHQQTLMISVGQHGYEGMVDFTISVEAGHPVTITFQYADDDLASDNPHVIKIEGPAAEGLPTVTVDREHPTATLTFTPTATGMLRIMCIVPCIGMENLMGGQIKVVKPVGSGAATSLALDLSPRSDGDVLAEAMLTTADGKPLGGVPITFTLRTSVGGELALAAAATMQDGSAVVRIPATSAEKLQITASFEGNDELGYAQASGEITVPGAPMEHPLGALSMPTAPPVMAMTLLVVLGGIWATYGFVVFQMFRIRQG